MATPVVSLKPTPGKKTSGPSTMALTPHEGLLLQRPTLTWYSSAVRCAVKAGGIINAANVDTEAFAAPIDQISGADVLPTRVGYSDYNNLPYYTFASTDPAGGCQTGAGVINFSGAVSGWTIAWIGRRASNTAGVIVGIQGVGGGAIGFCHRSDDKLTALVYDATGAAGSPLFVIDLATGVGILGDLGVSLGSGLDRRFIVSKESGANIVRVWVNGVLAYQGTPAIAPNESSLTIGKAYDTNYSAMGATAIKTSDANDARLYQIMCFGEKATTVVKDAETLKDWIANMQAELTTAA